MTELALVDKQIASQRQELMEADTPEKVSNLRIKTQAVDKQLSKLRMNRYDKVQKQREIAALYGDECYKHGLMTKDLPLRGDGRPQNREPVHSYSWEDLRFFSRWDMKACRSYALGEDIQILDCLLYTSPSPRDATLSRMPSSA